MSSNAGVPPAKLPILGAGWKILERAIRATWIVVLLVVFVGLVSPAHAHGDFSRITASDAPDPISFSSSSSVSTMTVDAYVLKLRGLSADDDGEDDDCDDDRRRRDHKREFFLQVFYTIHSSSGQLVRSFETQVPIKAPLEVVRLPKLNGRGTKRFIHLAPIRFLWNGKRANGTAVANGVYKTTVFARFGRDHHHGRRRDRIIDTSNVVRGTITVVPSPSGPPGITITSPATGAMTAQASISVTGQVTGTEPLTVTVAGVAATRNGSTYTATVPLVPGANILTAIVRDPSNQQAQASVTVTRDSTAPIISVIRPPDGSQGRDPRPAFEVAYQDVGSELDLDSFEATLDGQTMSSSFVKGPSSATFTPSTNLPDSQHVLVVAIRDRAGNRSESRSSFITDATGPFLAVSPTTGSFSRTGTPTLAATYADPVTSVDLASFRGYVSGIDSTSAFAVGPVQASFTVPASARLPNGPATFRAVIADRVGNVSDLTSNFVVDDLGPVVSITSPPDGAEVTTATPTVSFDFSDNVNGSGIQPSSVRLSLDGIDRTAELVVGPGSAQLTLTAPLSATEHQVTATAADRAGNSTSVSSRFTVRATEPPGGVPDLQPTPIDPTVSTLLSSTTSFLFTGPSAVQTGVAPGALDTIRMAVLKGRILEPSGGPAPGSALPPLASVPPTGVASLGGVTISVAGHPELGSTMTHADGTWDMAVNGGGAVTVDFKKDGYLPVQRRVDANWQNFSMCPDVVMTPITTQVTQIDFSEPIQVARGLPVTDADGTRTATLLFFQGTTASMVRSDGTSSPLPVLNVRATEHTAGANGPNAMPGQLPAQSGYTYCASFTVDEALAAGAAHVNFSQPIVFYQENFLGFPVGTSVPQGFYDSTQSQWVPSTNGLVVQILSVTGGLADLDVDGTGQPANSSTLASLGISDIERQRIAGLYGAGQSLWRAPLPHVSTWDSNWGIVPPEDAISPQCRIPGSKKPG